MEEGSRKLRAESQWKEVGWSGKKAIPIAEAPGKLRWMEGKAFFASRSLKWKVTSGGYVVTFTTTIVGIARSVTPLLLAVPGQGQ